jgi:glycogen(starch) synthase
MKILLCSHVFAPSIGGIETVSSILARQFCRLGATVKVVTHTPGEPISVEYETVRRPSLTRLLQLGREADIIFQNNISLRTLLPLLLCRKPVFIVHQGCIAGIDGSRDWQHHVKRALLRTCHNVAISTAIAATLPVASVVIGNPFETDDFPGRDNAPRSRDIVFLGRLVSEKGCDLALQALSILKQEGLRPSFTVIGDGTEMPKLKRLTAELGLESQVEFLGSLREGRGREVAKHKIMVVPSKYDEPFGVVALEGIASGCVVVASKGGGLPEAVGPCGMLFPNGDAKAMASALKDLLENSGLREKYLSQTNRHLESFKPEVVAKRYLDLLESALRK